MIQSPAADAAGQTVWIVTVDPAAALNDVVRALRDTGLKVDKVYDQFSIVVTEGSPAAASSARAVPGVAGVEQQQAFDVGPPQV